ncbi:Homeobox-DDT domain protein RLT3 [Vitis vinifera]|uniref:Homeobox-DDT domain protein RLT3 n=1 Tax=Vitis vinifera TaxID=29760 RepID=A0A438HYU4_VITVI|nr:Homeobox-DDT domain protein RLT3 [Vitis vinifera]
MPKPVVLMHSPIVLHFLYTYSVVVDVCPFTLDEFAQAFHDEIAQYQPLRSSSSGKGMGGFDSLLLGKVHLALLNLLLSDVETELSSGFLPHVIKNCKFLGLLQSIGNVCLIIWTEELRANVCCGIWTARPGCVKKESYDIRVGMSDGGSKEPLHVLQHEAYLTFALITEDDVRTNALQGWILLLPPKSTEIAVDLDLVGLPVSVIQLAENEDLRISSILITMDLGTLFVLNLKSLSALLFSPLYQLVLIPVENVTRSVTNPAKSQTPAAFYEPQSHQIHRWNTSLRKKEWADWPAQGVSGEL